jgi:hypothetical protein
MATELLEEDELRYDDETDQEAEVRRKTTIRLTPQQQALVSKLIDKVCMPLCDKVSGNPLRPYQIPFGRRIFESLIINDGAIITALFSRQSGKTETVANVIATAMIIIPRLAKLYSKELPSLEIYLKEGLAVGAFGPVDEQADNLFGRIVARLNSDSAAAVLSDREIDDEVKGRGKVCYLVNCKSLVRKTTCHPKAKIEGRTYHIILIDECQDAHSKTVKKSVNPMGAATNATRVWTGTPTYEKNIFYIQIQNNKRAALQAGRKKNNHFEIDWRVVAKCVPVYERFVLNEMREMGADSDEFRLSYKIEWLLDKGMFTSSEEFAELSDISVQALEKSWHWSPVCVGIDCARKKDRTVVTVVWVRWDQKDSMGFHDHRILNWLDLEGVSWENQYYRIVEFLSAYNIYKVGIDTGGVGDVVFDRLQTLMPHVEFVPMLDSPGEQSRRFKYLKQLKERKMIKWPAGAKVRNLKVFKRFAQDMSDAELEYKGPNIAVSSPEAADAHDDYVDSLAMAAILSKEDDESEAGQMVVYENVFFARSHR